MNSSPTFTLYRHTKIEPTNRPWIMKAPILVRPYVVAYPIKFFEGHLPYALGRIGLGDLHAADLQNCLCEMDEFVRARLGEGKPKRRFVPR